MKSTASCLLRTLMLSCVLGVAGCGDADSGTSSTSEAGIGLLMPLTGDAAFVADARNGARVAVDEINDGAGGIRIGSRRIEVALYTQDTASVPDAAVEGARALLGGRRVVALIGPTSRSILSVVPLVREAGVVEISPFAGTTALDTRGGCLADECVFRTVSSDVVMGSGMAWYAKEVLAAQKVAFFFSDDIGARSVAGVLDDATQVLGLDLVGTVFFTPGKDSYVDELAAAFAGAPDVIFFESGPADASVFLREWQTAQLGGQWIGTDFVNDAFVQQASPFNEGVYGVNPGPVLDDRYTEWAHEYERVIGSPIVAQFAANTYDAVVLVALALERGGEISRATVREYLREVATPPGEECRSFIACAALLHQGHEIDYDGISGPQDFNAFGDPISPLKAEQVQDGALARLRSITDADIGDVIEQVLGRRS